MSSLDSLQLELIDPDTQERLTTIKDVVKTVEVLGKRINLQVLDKKGVEKDLARIFDVKPDAIAIVEIPGPDAASIKNPGGGMLLVPLQIGSHCTIKIKHLPDTKISWEVDKEICVRKSVEVEISPGGSRAILIVIEIIL